SAEMNTSSNPLDDANAQILNTVNGVLLCLSSMAVCAEINAILERNWKENEVSP
ncbi:hypothetical protein KI387_004794, partial [Taxus chinensis]